MPYRSSTFLGRRKARYTHHTLSAILFLLARADLTQLFYTCVRENSRRLISASRLSRVPNIPFLRTKINLRACFSYFSCVAKVDHLPPRARRRHGGRDLICRVSGAGVGLPAVERNAPRERKLLIELCSPAAAAAAQRPESFFPRPLAAAALSSVFCYILFTVASRLPLTVKAGSSFFSFETL